MPLSKHPRSPHSPSPIYGIRPGFTVGDLDASFLTSLHVYGTWSAGSVTPTWNATTGRWAVADALTAQASASDPTGTIVSPNARAIKVGINISGTGSVHLTMKSAVDSYVAVIQDFGVLTAGFYEIVVGGWASASGDGSVYQATRYGPTFRGNSPVLSEDTIHPNHAADSNYFGQTYNPFQFLSLDGYAVKFFSVVAGTVGYDVSVTALS